MTISLRRTAALSALVLGLAAPAGAQTPYASQKNSENLSNGMSYMEPDNRSAGSQYESRERTTTAPAERLQPRPVATVEPEAGESEFADFTGPYIGGDVGYGMGNADVSGGVAGDVGLDGWSGSLLGGFGYDTGDSFLGGYGGLEFGYTWNEMDGTLDGVQFEKGDSMHVTLRPGLVVNQDALGYGIIGYSRAEFESGGDDDHLDGLILGAGAEFNTESAFKPRLEYQYTTYEDVTIGGNSLDPHDNVIKLGAVFRL